MFEVDGRSRAERTPQTWDPRLIAQFSPPGLGGPRRGPPTAIPVGGCFPCPTEAAPPSPDLEEKRAKPAEDAERRQKEAASRSILNVQFVEEKRKKKGKIEKEMATSEPPPESGLRRTVL
ncbi:small VCP/p97-interacting protein-like [Cervus elaphus]|uniref:small VCP/p97-interacting protein-like n=1 Tax=Cervus elaphus TaxID=9860 RepID=UPI001CC2D060|nr:small VCP/p97-interacting protein-like [Cervus elaphus]